MDDETCYEMIDRFLRNNLGDDDYAEYSEALDQLSRPTPRTWIRLKDELLRKLHHEDQFGLFCDYDEFEQIARAIEVKLNEKNT